jgi:hypothetical protein
MSSSTASGSATGGQPPAKVGGAAAPPQWVVVPVKLTTTTTIGGTLHNENIASDLQNLQSTQQKPVLLMSGEPMAPGSPSAAGFSMFWDRATKAVPSGNMDEQRAALFVELVKAAFKPQKSDQELGGLEWWAGLVKQKRIQAANGAKQAYNVWQSGQHPRTSPIGQLLGDDKVNTPSYDTLVAEGFGQVSGTDAANKSWPMVLKHLEAAQIDLQKNAGNDTDVLTILDGIVEALSILKDGLTGWTSAAATAYQIASARWKQIQAAQDLPGQLDAFVSFAKATTPSLTENLQTEGGAKLTYVALIETIH